jgi:hypothetical protein
MKRIAFASARCQHFTSALRECSLPLVVVVVVVLLLLLLVVVVALVLLLLVVLVVLVLRATARSIPGRGPFNGLECIRLYYHRRAPALQPATRMALASRVSCSHMTVVAPHSEPLGAANQPSPPTPDLHSQKAHPIRRVRRTAPRS